MKEEGVKTVRLCGSTRFKEAHVAAAKNETLAGRVVLMSPIFSHADNDALTDKQCDTLKRLHRQKIHMCDEVLIINRFGYIGESTQAEINFACGLGKTIRFLEPDDFSLNLSELTDSEVSLALENHKLSARTHEVYDLIRTIYDRHVLESVTDKFQRVYTPIIHRHFAVLDADLSAQELVDEFEDMPDHDLNDEIRAIQAEELINITFPILDAGLQAPPEFATEWFVVSEDFAVVAKKLGEFVEESSIGWIWGRRPYDGYFRFQNDVHIDDAIIPILKRLAN